MESRKDMRKARAAKLTKKAEREAERAAKKAYIDQLKALVKAEREAEMERERAKRKAEREAAKAAAALEAAKEAAKKKEPTPVELWQKECDEIMEELQDCNTKNAADLMRRYSELQYRIETEHNLHDHNLKGDFERVSREVRAIRDIRPGGLLSK